MHNTIGLCHYFLGLRLGKEGILLPSRIGVVLFLSFISPISSTYSNAVVNYEEPLLLFPGKTGKWISLKWLRVWPTPSAGRPTSSSMTFAEYSGLKM